jgi:Ser/Thr protein kinase RdoA (MazF antagonist)
MSSEPATTGGERLQSHLEARYAISVARVSELDVGVHRIDRHNGPSWVARVFPAARPAERAVADSEILRLLALHDFPAERRATAEPISMLDGQAVLVTLYVEPVPRPRRAEMVRALGGFRSRGEMLGRLHTLSDSEVAITWNGGCWHHVGDGGPRDEIAAAGRLLAGAEGLVPRRDRALYESLRAEFDDLDGCDGLPQALIHPDFALPNVVASPDDGLVVVDWTGAGRGARLWSLAFLLLSAGARDLRRVDRVVAGYRVHVRPEPEELSRLAAVARVRMVVLTSWAFWVGRRGLAETVAEVAEIRELADAVGARAREAFSAS